MINNLSSSMPSMMKRNRHVHFDSFSTVIDIPSICSEGEDNQDLIRSMWYSDHELFLIQMSARNDLQAKEEEIQNYCIDLAVYKENGQVRKEESITNVILQQELLWDDKIEDPELIAEVYAEDTESSQIEATQRGIHHAKHVNEIKGMNTSTTTSTTNLTPAHAEYCSSVIDDTSNCSQIEECNFLSDYHTQTKSSDDVAQDREHLHQVSLNEGDVPRGHRVNLNLLLQQVLHDSNINRTSEVYTGDIAFNPLVSKRPIVFHLDENSKDTLFKYNNSTAIFTRSYNDEMISLSYGKDLIARSRRNLTCCRRKYIAPYVESSSRIWDRGRPRHMISLLWVRRRQ